MDAVSSATESEGGRARSVYDGLRSHRNQFKSDILYRRWTQMGADEQKNAMGSHLNP